MTAWPGVEHLARAAAELVGGDRRAILGITGPPGAGKTTLAEDLLAALSTSHGPDWVAHLPMDGFHLGDAQLARLGALDRVGAPDTFDAAGYAHTLRRVAGHPDETIYVPGFERTLEQPLAAALVVPPSARLVLTEGNYLLLDDPAWQDVRRHLAAVWYVTTDDDVRRERLVARHVEFGKTPVAAQAWAHGTDEVNAGLVAQTRVRADRVVVNGPDGWDAA